jgi:nuclear pore complex protein Nup133
MIKPWTSKPAVIDMVLDLFETTTRILESPTDLDTADRSAKSEPMRQLPELASLLFATIYERLEWLRRYVYFITVHSKTQCSYTCLKSHGG